MADDQFYQTALKKAMALCAMREHCTGEIRCKLAEWGVSNSDSVKILTFLTGEKFISDNRYAAAFTRDKFRQNKWGRLKIASHLRAKGISEETIRKGLAEINEDNYRDTIRELISSHRRLTKAKNKYDMKGKLLRFGLSKGFESHLLYDLLNEPD